MIPAGFFPDQIHYFFSETRFDQSVLSANELLQAQRYGSKRLSDFSTGRHCLRQTLLPFGFTGDILTGERGMPLLPDGITASVSHSMQLCGAVACSKDSFLSVGIDIETIGRVSKEMWYLLFTAREMAYLNTLQAADVPEVTTVFFSLKEAFYKLQYPITNVFLDMTDVEVEAVDGRYYVRLLHQVHDSFRAGQLVAGSLLLLNGQVLTYCTMPPMF